MLNFYTPYRVESADRTLSYLAVVGASKLQGNRWSLWVWEADPYSSPVLEWLLKDLEVGANGAITATLDVTGQVPVTFTPLTPAYVAEQASQYGLTEAQVAALNTSGFMYALFSGDMAVQYEEKLAPKEATESRLAEDKAPVGALRMANGSFYEKQPDGLWVKVDWFP